MIGTTALKAYNDSIRHAVPEIVDDLRRALGAKLVAYIARVSETRGVREWAEAARGPTPENEARLRLAHRIVTLIGQCEGEAIVATWFQGMNPQLGDRSRARVLHEDSFDEAGARVLAAANAFVGATDAELTETAQIKMAAKNPQGRANASVDVEQSMAVIEKGLQLAGSLPERRRI